MSVGPRLRALLCLLAWDWGYILAGGGKYGVVKSATIWYWAWKRCRPISSTYHVPGFAVLGNFGEVVSNDSVAKLVIHTYCELQPRELFDYLLPSSTNCLLKTGTATQKLVESTNLWISNLWTFCRFNVCQLLHQKEPGACFINAEAPGSCGGSELKKSATHTLFVCLRISYYEFLTPGVDLLTAWYSAKRTMCALHPYSSYLCGMELIFSLRTYGKRPRRFLKHTGKEGVIAFTGRWERVRLLLSKPYARSWGTGDQVNSPTFTLVNEYLSTEGIPIYHFDFYRIKTFRKPWTLVVKSIFETPEPFL